MPELQRHEQAPLASGNGGQAKSGGPNPTLAESRLWVRRVVHGEDTGTGPWTGGAMPTPCRTPSSSNDTYIVLRMCCGNLVVTYKIIHKVEIP